MWWGDMGRLHIPARDCMTLSPMPESIQIWIVAGMLSA